MSANLTIVHMSLGKPAEAEKVWEFCHNFPLTILYSLVQPPFFSETHRISDRKLF